jgi:predicted RNA-binding Zn ribbon-like protein
MAMGWHAAAEELRQALCAHFLQDERALADASKENDGDQNFTEFIRAWPKDLDDPTMQWVEHARVMIPPDCTYVRTTVAKRPKLSRAIFEHVLEVREVVWMIGTALAEQRPVSEELRASLTAAHAESLRFAKMKMRDGAYIWTWDPRRDVQAAILGPITLSALTLLMEKELSRTKRCAGMECGWLFFDTTKNSRRRWCEMRVCGNRAKVRAARARQKSTRKV